MKTPVEPIDNLPRESPLPAVPAGADRVLISVNPRAGRESSRQRAADLEALVRLRGLDVRLCESLDEVCELANQWQAEGSLRALVGIGGDGTAAELTNRTNAAVPITFLACGTANLLSKHVGLCNRPEKLCETIVAGNIVRMDVGRAGSRLFLAMLGCGFDADVVEQMHKWRNRRQGGHIRYLSYAKPIWKSVRRYDYPAIQIHCCVEQSASESELVDARWAFIMNLPRYGWGLPLAPQAVPDDGLLDLCVFRRGSWWAGAQYLAATQVGWHGRMPDCSMRRGCRFRLESDRLVPYQLDGDPGGVLPVEVEVLPGRLTLLVPEGCRLLHGGGRT